MICFQDTPDPFAAEDMPTMDTSEGVDLEVACSAFGVKITSKAGLGFVKPSKSQQKTGRKQTEGSQLLSGVRTSKNKPLKTEYKRCQFIRLIKKMTRELSEFKFSKKFLREYGVNNEENIHLQRRLQQIYLDNKEVFDSNKDTESGPATDGKSKGKRRNAAQPKSFNKKYCREFYMPECVREFHSVLVDLIYGRIDREVDPAVLCRKFNEFCCNSSQHSVICVKKWTNVLKYMKTTVIKDLDLEPFYEFVDCAEPVIFSEHSEVSEIDDQLMTPAESLHQLELPDTPVQNFDDFDEIDLLAY